MVSLQPPPVQEIEGIAPRFAGWLRDLWSRSAKSGIGGVAGNIVQINVNGDYADSGVDVDDILEPSDVLGTTDEITATDNGDGTITISLPGSIKLDSATASRLLATDSSKKTVSADLDSWIAGTANEINITDDGDGSVTIGIVDPLAVNKGGSGQSSYTNGQLLIGNTTGNTLAKSTLTGTANQITITNGTGTITVSIPDPLVVVGLTTSGARIEGTTRIINAASPYAVLSTDHVIYCDTDAGAITANLPAGVEGTNYKLINCGGSGNDLTVDPNGTEQLCGAGAGVASALTDGEVIDIHYNAAEGWW